MNPLFTNEDPGKEDIRKYTKLNKIKILFSLGERKTTPLGNLPVSSGFARLLDRPWTVAAN